MTLHATTQPGATANDAQSDARSLSARPRRTRVTFSHRFGRGRARFFAGLVLIIIFYVVAALAEFVAPYN
jgi:hypothetical protein